MPLTQEEMHAENQARQVEVEHRLTRLEVLNTVTVAGVLYLAALLSGHMLGFTVNGAFWLP